MFRGAMVLLLAGWWAGTPRPGWAELIWIGGESAQVKKVHPNSGLDEVDTDELSGRAWFSSFSENGKPAGVVGCAVKIDRPGPYTLWVRANDLATGLAFRVDAPTWVPVHAKAMAEEDKSAREEWQQTVRAVERKRKGAPAVAPPEPAARVVDPRSVSLDGSPGFRALAWINLGIHTLSAGAHKLEFLLGSDGVKTAEKMWNAVDCLVLTDEPFKPRAKFRPGETCPSGSRR